MKVFSVLQIGDYHINHCEDYLIIADIGKDKMLCAVMDGCTMGTDSYFVSTLVGKLLRKIAKEKSYKELYGVEPSIDIDDVLKSILNNLFKELNIAKNQLMLEKSELLTTLIILVIDKRENKGIVLAIGDGLISINGKLIEFDHDNKPDYLGFHLSEEFDSWYQQQEQKITFNYVDDISITTDGMLMFAPVKKLDTVNMIDPIRYLLHDRVNIADDEMLSKKLKVLEHEHALKPTDDLAVIRVIS